MPHPIFNVTHTGKTLAFKKENILGTDNNNESADIYLHERIYHIYCTAAITSKNDGVWGYFGTKNAVKSLFECRDPPLVIQLGLVDNFDTNNLESTATLQNLDFYGECDDKLSKLSRRIMCVACLASERLKDIGCLVKFDAQGRNPVCGDILYGQTCQQGLFLDNQDQINCPNSRSPQKAVFFVFSDLAIKVPGLFSIKIMVVDLLHRDKVHVLSTTPFEVYSPKRFPGMMRRNLD